MSSFTRQYPTCSAPGSAEATSSYYPQWGVCLAPVLTAWM